MSAITRKELIESDEYIETSMEILIRSKKPVKVMRDEVIEWLKKYRDELIWDASLKPETT